MAKKNDDQGPLTNLEAFLAHNRRQRKAIRAYIIEVTGLELEQVPKEVQDRLAVTWVERYASQFRSLENELPRPKGKNNVKK